MGYKNIEKWYIQKCFKPAAYTSIILFLHAFFGCDTVSAFFNQGKKKFIDTLKKYPGLIQGIESFYSDDASKETLLTTGENCIKV